MEKFYGGGYKKPSTFMELIAKNLVDDVNSWVSKDSDNKDFKVCTAFYMINACFNDKIWQYRFGFLFYTFF